jgi:hypothetical protein
MAAEATGEFVEVGAHFVLALGEDEAEGVVVGGGFGDFAGALAEDFQDGFVAGEAVEALLAHFAEFDEFGLAELRQGHGDAALAHAEDLLEFGNAEFFAGEETEHAEARLITEKA